MLGLVVYFLRVGGNFFPRRELELVREYSSPLLSKMSKKIKLEEHSLGLETITGDDVILGLELEDKMDLDVCNVVSTVHITNLASKTIARESWIDDGKKKDDKSTKYNIPNIVKPFNNYNYNYNYNYNKIQHLSIPTPFLPVSPSNSPSLSAASLISCKESNHGNKDKNIRMIRLKESL